MDFLDPNKKRSNRIKLFIGYFLVAVAIGLASLILLLYVSGYAIDGGRIIQKGLVFISSRPEGAQVDIKGLHNNEEYQDHTNSRTEVKEGRYKVVLSAKGYRNWEREFNVDGGSVERMAYPFLFPEQLETQQMKNYQSLPQIVSSSPDRHWLVVMQPAAFGTFDVYDSGVPEKQPTSFGVPAGVLSPATGEQSLKVVEWSNDNVNFLCKHTFDGKTEFIIINRDKPEQSFNVNTLTGQSPSQVSLKDKHIDELFLHMGEGGLLQSFNVKTKVFTPLVAQTYAYKSYGTDMLVYVSLKADNPGLFAAYIRQGDKAYKLRDLLADTTYVVDVSRFSDAWYVAVGAASENKVFVYKNPLDVLASQSSNRVLFARTLRIENPQTVSFSANTRNIAVQSGQKFAVYDAETDRQYSYTISDKIDTDRPAEWMDGHRLATSTDGNVLIFDFDGLNQQKLMTIDPSKDVAYDRSYDFAFSLASNEDKTFSLTWTKLYYEDK